MASFRLLIDYDVVVFVETLGASARKTIRERLTEIRDHPTARSDYQEPDSIGRHVSINICGAYAIKFWVDHADLHIKILDIHLADRRR